MTDEKYIEKGCPNCHVTVRQVPERRAWHWCEDGRKYELTRDHVAVAEDAA